MDQTIINWIMAGGGAAVGWILKIIWDSIQDLKKDLKGMDSKMHDDFVRRDDFKDAMFEHKQDMQNGFREVKELIGALFKRLENKADK